MVTIAGILDRFVPSRLKAREAERQAAFAQAFASRLQASMYESAQTNAENENHWINARGLAPDAAADAGVRKTIRDRARYEDVNNSLCRGIVDTYVDSIYGTGPTLNVETGIAAADDSIERRFHEWCEERDVYEKGRLAYRDDTVAGEGLLLKTSDGAFRDGPKFDLVALECDRIADPTDDRSDPFERDGVRVSRSHVPAAYYVLDRHPGDESSHLPFDEGSWYPADRVICFSRRTRAEQIRGVSALTPALYVFATFRRFLFATVAAAETAASIAAVLKTSSSEIIQGAIDSRPGGVSPIENVYPMDTVDIVKRQFMTLPAGWDVGQMVAQHPNSTIEMFHRIAVMEVGRGFGMPYNVAAADSSDHNYASGRLDHQFWERVVAREQARLSRHWKFDLLRDWYREAALIPGYLHPACREIGFVDLRPEFFWDSLGHADPKKEAEAVELRLANNLTTLKIECARQRLDWRAVLDQRRVELERIATLPVAVGAGEQGGAGERSEGADSKPKQQAQRAGKPAVRDGDGDGDGILHEEVAA